MVMRDTTFFLIRIVLLNYSYQSHPQIGGGGSQTEIFKGVSRNIADGKYANGKYAEV